MNSNVPYYISEPINQSLNKSMTNGPRDVFTKFGFKTTQILARVLAIPLFFLTPITSGTIHVLNACTLGIIVIPFTLAWLVLFGGLLGSSWLWLKVPIFRPILLIPGIVIALIAYFYAHLMPVLGDLPGKWLKLGITSSWPYSYSMIKFYEAPDS